jgi:hypothetical protein
MPIDSSLSGQALERSPQRRKRKVFLIVNVTMLLLVMAALATNQHATFGSSMYISMLFFVCSSPLIFFKSFRGKASILICYLAYYFASFASQDIVGLFASETMPARSGVFMTPAEVAVLLGAMCFITGYVLTTLFKSSRRGGALSREWSPKAIGLIGIGCWITGYYITASWLFGVADQFSGVQVNIALGGFIALLRQLQVVGSLLLIYLYLTTGNKSVLAFLLFTMSMDFVLGFVGDTKELAFRAPILYLVSIPLLRERIPVKSLVLFVLIAGLAFNYFSAYRMDVHSSHVSRMEALKNIGSKLERIEQQKKTLGKRLDEGLDYFVDRIYLKNYVEMVIARAGKDIEYLHGYTLKPLLYIFVPRLILPDKQGSGELGQLFNRKFSISDSPDTFIAISQLGELFWNFGWAGVILGMMVLGAIMGRLGAAFRLDSMLTAIKFLLLLTTIYVLVFRSESSIALSFTIWVRLTLLLLLMHLFVPKDKARGLQQGAGARSKTMVAR